MADTGNPVVTLNHTSGRLEEKKATVTSVGAGDAGKIPGLDTTGKLDSSLLPVGIGADVQVLPTGTGQTLDAGEWVNIYDDSGTTSVRKADATTTGKEAHGFVLAGTTAGQDATVYFEGTNNQLSGLSAPGRLFLSTTAGDGSETPPAASGNIVQKLGDIVSATEVATEISDGILLA